MNKSIYNNMEELPVWEITVEDSELLEIALVDFPAIEENFLKFNKEEKTVLLFNSDKMIVSGLVMVPNKLIYRNDSLGERYVFYNEETISKSAQLFLKNGMKFNVNHTDEKVKLEVIESYLTKKNNEFNAPIGSWVVTARVNDNKLWEDIKMGQFNGFSFQSLFISELTKFNSDKNNNKLKKSNKMDIKEKLMKAINTVLFAEDAPIVDVPVEDVAVVVEDVVAVVEEAPVVDPVAPTEDEIKALVESAIVLAVEALAANFDAKLDALKAELTVKVDEVSADVVEFGKQTVPSTEKEVVDNPKKMVSKASKYFTK